MAFQQGLSGLASSARALDVISSNVANANTVGFKSSGVVFADTFASAMTGAMSNIQVGAGGAVSAVRQSFSQGGLTTTNNPLDMAINGNGFFTIERNNGTTAYTRNGQFDLDKDGFIVTPLGERLMGYQSVNPATGVVTLTGSGTPVPLYVPPQGINAKATADDGTTPAVNVRANLDSASLAPTTAPFSKDDPSSYNSTTSIRVYDSLGNDHTLGFYFVKDGTTTNTWDVYTTFDGVDSPTPAAPATTLTFDSVGRPTGGTTFTFGPEDPGNGADPLGFTANLGSFTQTSAPFSVYELRQNGYPPGEIAGVAVTSDGIVQGRYSNGQTQNLGQVVLATFRNPNGLSSLGNNLWGETTESGQSALGIPGAGLNGTLSAGQIEESNVDMSQELVQMIIQQRNYQANAQSIRTQDQILQTLINLR